MGIRIKTDFRDKENKERVTNICETPCVGNSDAAQKRSKMSSMLENV